MEPLSHIDDRTTSDAKDEFRARFAAAVIQVGNDTFGCFPNDEMSGLYVSRQAIPNALRHPQRKYWTGNEYHGGNVDAVPFEKLAGAIDQVRANLKKAWQERGLIQRHHLQTALRRADGDRRRTF